jgi:hypothetical protein
MWACLPPVLDTGRQYLCAWTNTSNGSRWHHSLQLLKDEVPARLNRPDATLGEAA